MAKKESSITGADWVRSLRKARPHRAGTKERISAQIRQSPYYPKQFNLRLQ